MTVDLSGIFAPGMERKSEKEKIGMGERVEQFVHLFDEVVDDNCDNPEVLGYIFDVMEKRKKDVRHLSFRAWGEKAKKLRKKHRFTMQDVADVMGLSRSHYSIKECGAARADEEFYLGVKQAIEKLLRKTVQEDIENGER